VCIGNGQANQSVSDKAGALSTMHDQQAVMVLNDQGGSVMDVSNESTATLRAQSHGHEPAVMVAAVDCRNLNEHQEVSGTLQCKQNGGYSLNYQNHIRVQGEVAHTLKAKANCDFRADSETYPVQNSVVRRLTPLEAERLQGYPDGWTDIGEWVDSKGKKHKPADSPRYKALGNSIALPFWFWLLRRISAQYYRPATLGSLFDGIGGFPLCWERCNGMGTALWASEIEEFPIAVTKKHFGY
jgi:DNA (cytosine-5)-methyltransferase 1